MLISEPIKNHLQELQDEVKMKLKGVVALEIVSEKSLHIKTTSENLRLETIEKVVNILLQTKKFKFTNLAFSTINNVVVVEKK